MKPVSPLHFSALIVKETGRISSTNMPLYDYSLTSDGRRFPEGMVLRVDQEGRRDVMAVDSRDVGALCRELPMMSDEAMVTTVTERLTDIVRNNYKFWNLTHALRGKFEKATRTGELLQRTDAEVSRDRFGVTVDYKKPLA